MDNLNFAVHRQHLQIDRATEPTRITITDREKLFHEHRFLGTEQEIKGGGYRGHLLVNEMANTEKQYCVVYNNML